MVPSIIFEIVICPAELKELAGHFYELKKNEIEVARSEAHQDFTTMFRYRRLREQYQEELFRTRYPTSDSYTKFPVGIG
jgi:hypothetical protein